MQRIGDWNQEDEPGWIQVGGELAAGGNLTWNDKLFITLQLLINYSPHYRNLQVIHHIAATYYPATAT